MYTKINTLVKDMRKGNCNILKIQLITSDIWRYIKNGKAEFTSGEVEILRDAIANKIGILSKKACKLELQSMLLMMNTISLLVIELQTLCSAILILDSQENK